MVDLFLFGQRIFNSRNGGVMENENTKISVALGYTLNLGNFQSLRFDFGIVDSKRDDENTEQAFERIYKFVEEKLTEKVKEIILESGIDIDIEIGNLGGNKHFREYSKSGKLVNAYNALILASRSKRK